MSGVRQGAELLNWRDRDLDAQRTPKALRSTHNTYQPLAETVNELSTKRCLKCRQLLPLEEFGICRARKDGRNAYCPECVRAKVYGMRHRVKEMKTARLTHKERLANGIWIPERKASVFTVDIEPTVPEKIETAVKEGNVTREQIWRATKLTWDQLGEGLADLTFRKHVLKVVRNGSQREFHLAA